MSKVDRLDWFCALVRQLARARCYSKEDQAKINDVLMVARAEAMRVEEETVQ